MLAQDLTHVPRPFSERAGVQVDFFVALKRLLQSIRARRFFNSRTCPSSGRPPGVFLNACFSSLFRRSTFIRSNSLPTEEHPQHPDARPFETETSVASHEATSLNHLALVQVGGRSSR